MHNYGPCYTLLLVHTATTTTPAERHTQGERHSVASPPAPCSHPKTE